MKHSMTRVLARVDHDDDDEVCYGCCGPMWAGSDARTLLIDCTETLALPAANYPLSLSQTQWTFLIETPDPISDTGTGRIWSARKVL